MNRNRKTKKVSDSRWKNSRIDPIKLHKIQTKVLLTKSKRIFQNLQNTKK